jgi:hypothetical protein
VEGLFRLLPDTHSAGESGSMDTAQAVISDLEATETRQGAVCSALCPWREQVTGGQNGRQCSWSIASGQQSCPHGCVPQLLLRRAWATTAVCWPIA